MMKMNGIDEKKVLLNLKDSLAKEGIISSWGNKLFHRAAYNSDMGSIVAGSRLYIPLLLTAECVPSSKPRFSNEAGFCYLLPCFSELTENAEIQDAPQYSCSFLTRQGQCF